MTRMMRTIRSVLIAATLALASHAPEAADTGWEACLTDLTLRRINDPTIANGTVEGLGDDGRRVSFGLGEVFYLLPTRPPEPRRDAASAGEPMMLTLVDGQRFPVIPLESEDPDRLRVRSVWGGRERSFGLGRVLALRRADSAGADPSDPDPLDDRVVLANGDAVRGFVRSIGREVAIETDDGGVRRFGIDAVRSVTIVNDPVTEPGVQIRLWDSTRLRVESLAARPGARGWAEVGPDGAEPFRVGFEPDAFGGLEITHDASRLAGLWTLASTHEPTGGRAWTPEPRVMAPGRVGGPLRDIDLRAPVRVAYELGAGAARFACTARLVAGRWSDCELVVACRTPGGLETIARARLKPSEPVIRINEALPRGARTLVVRVEPGAHGAIQDRVILESARVRIDALAEFE